METYERKVNILESEPSFFGSLGFAPRAWISSTVLHWSKIHPASFWFKAPPLEGSVSGRIWDLTKSQNASLCSSLQYLLGSGCIETRAAFRHSELPRCLPTLPYLHIGFQVVKLVSVEQLGQTYRSSSSLVSTSSIPTHEQWYQSSQPPSQLTIMRWSSGPRQIQYSPPSLDSESDSVFLGPGVWLGRRELAGVPALPSILGAEDAVLAVESY